MGHDISAFSVDDEPVAYLRRGAFQETAEKNELYALLNAEEHNKSVSGDGEAVLFTPEQIHAALLDAIENKATDDVLDFLKNCSEEVGETGIIIVFG